MEEQSKLTDEQLAARLRLSENLKRIRASQGLSQEALADRAGLHRTYTSQVERRIVNASLDNIVLLARALGVDVSELFANVADDSESTTERIEKKTPSSSIEKKPRHKAS